MTAQDVIIIVLTVALYSKAESELILPLEVLKVSCIQLREDDDQRTFLDER